MNLKKVLFSVATLTLVGIGNSDAQMVGTDCFLFSPTVEVGLHTNGYEGSSTLPPFPSHYRGGTGRIGFLANPEEDAWVNYDGDFYLPGFPANSFGLGVGGTFYKNGADGAADQIPSSGLSGYSVVGNCQIVDWNGSQAGVDIMMQYKMDNTTTYYTVDVTLTNTTATDLPNVYFYKTCDPDNMVDLVGGAGFTTDNEIVSQPTPFCPKSLVSAKDEVGWTSYMGYGAVDPNTRVFRGGGLNPSNAADMWNGTGGITGTLGTFTADQAIGIVHRETIPAGSSINFQFVVILDESQVEEAILSLYFVDYDGSGGALSSCTATEVDVDGDGDDDPLPDTLYKDCSTGPLTLSLDGPYLGMGYSITWTNMDTGEDIGTGAEVTVSPSGTTLYRVVASPAGACFDLDIERFVIVEVTGDQPDVVITDPGPQCGSFDLTDLTVTDAEGLPGSFIEYYTELPDSIDDPTDIMVGTTVLPGDEVYVLLGITATGCFDVEPLDIEFVEISAGEDSTGFEMCNSGVATADMGTFLVGADTEGRSWHEDASNPTLGGLDPATRIFDPTGLAPGDYLVNCVIDGGGVCENDTAFMTISVYDQPDAGADNSTSICNASGFFVDLSTLLSGADAGGVWSESTPTGGAFDPSTGIFLMDGIIAAGDYVFNYTLSATAPCIEDVATFTVTVNSLPTVVAGPDQSICDGDETFVAASGTDGTSYVWEPAVITDGTPFTPAVGSVNYVVTGTDGNGCVSQDSLTIEVHALPVISFSTPTLAGCTPFNTDFTVVSDQEIATTDWSFGDGETASVSTSPVVSHTYTESGLNTVSATVTDIYGCITSITYPDYITVEDMPVAAFTFAPQHVFTNDTEVDFTNESLHATDYSWDFGDASDNTAEENPNHFFPTDVADIFYPVKLSASNYLGCTDVATGYLNVRGIIIFYVPNAFTPDGDVYNETFKPVFTSGFDPYNFHMVIYNRWGEVVFESYDASAGWDGSYGDKGIISDGVYTWSIEFKEAFSDAKHFEVGTVYVSQ